MISDRLIVVENENRASFPFVSSRKKVVGWPVWLNLPYFTLLILRCDYCAYTHCDINAKTIYCTALIVTEHYRFYNILLWNWCQKETSISEVDSVAIGKHWPINQLVDRQSIGDYFDNRLFVKVHFEVLSAQNKSLIPTSQTWIFAYFLNPESFTMFCHFIDQMINWFIYIVIRRFSVSCSPASNCCFSHLCCFCHLLFVTCYCHHVLRQNNTCHSQASY